MGYAPNAITGRVKLPKVTAGCGLLSPVWPMSTGALAPLLRTEDISRNPNSLWTHLQKQWSDWATQPTAAAQSELHRARYLLLTFLSWLPSLSLPMSALQSLTAHESTLETERWREALFTLHLYLLVALAKGFEQKRELETIGPNDAPRETAPMLSGS